MAWNESGNGKNPWDRGGNDGPPDLDKIVRDWQRKFNSMFGGKGSRSSAGGAEGGSEGPRGSAVGLRRRWFRTVFLWTASQKRLLRLPIGLTVPSRLFLILPDK